MAAPLSACTNSISRLIPSPGPQSAARTSSIESSGIENQRIQAVYVEPTNKRRKIGSGSLYDKSDEEVWAEDDEKIIASTQSRWSSIAYQHYTVSLKRVIENGRKKIYYVFTCKSQWPGHKPQERGREGTSQGTSNLLNSAKKCDSERGVPVVALSSGKADVPPYSISAHRAVIALRCAKHHRPFNYVTDEYYKMEVQMLRPGTIIPHPTTVSTDIKFLYIELGEHVKEYFKKRNRAIHLAIDGWTAPIIASFLGVVVIWYEQGRIYRAILEFIRLTESHTGKYLAEVLVNCIRRFGLENFLHTLCMDNAGNCNTTATEAQKLLPNFRGSASRTRCFPHIVNLIAKAFISFFFKQYKRKKKVTVAARTRRSSTRMPQASEQPLADYAFEEFVLQDGEALSAEDSELAETLADEAAPTDDAGQEAHDDHVVATLRDRAIAEMRARGVFIPAMQEKQALGIFPRVAGLARKVHDSTTLGEQFDSLVKADQSIKGDKRALARRVPTRWNSDLACLEAHVHFRKIVEQLTAPAANKLGSYRLSNMQWELAIELVDIFDGPTRLFSQKEVPLVMDAIPMLEDLIAALRRVCDASDVPAVIRVAAHSGVLLAEKYYGLLAEECEVYRLAIVMSPDKKLDWFRRQGWSTSDIEDVRALAIQRWEESYKPPPPEAPATSSSSLPTAPHAPRGARWLSRVNETPTYPPDSIYAYLEDPCVPDEMVKLAGGVMKYWDAAESKTPCLAAMGSDFCSAPASSTDTERAFSEGRREVNFMQHNVSSQTFRAEMAVGSWDGTPLLTDVSQAVQILEKKVRGEREQERIEQLARSVAVSNSSLVRRHTCTH